MRLWYWFLLILFIVGFVLVVVSQYLIFVMGEFELSWKLSIYGAIILGFVLGVGALYFERWRRRWLRS
ncbi:hypothetical protein E3J74_07130 [Candidatus Bathyarchaeota archaeon]|nr:MAG: hypothetical protein E3J74_07130 [Candidatus Bathyarchaeota archaeon]